VERTRPRAAACEDDHMSDLERRRGGHLTRRQREQRVLRLMVVGGVSGVAGAIGLVLAIAGVVGAGIPILLLVLAAVCALIMRRTLSG
jgi:hypothetical protein